MPQIVPQKYCDKCHKTVRLDDFYMSNNTEKYKDGHLNQCKKCITMHVDNWEPESFLWILQEADVPWIPDEWNKLLSNYGKDKAKVSGMTIIGRYLSKMRLKNFKDYRWKDNAFLQEMADHRISEAMKRQGYEAADIAKVIGQGHFAMPDQPLEIPEYDDTPTFGEDASQAPPEDYFDTHGGQGPDIESDLTQEDRTYLSLKWGKAYRPDEWVQLEQLYQEMLQSYDINLAGDLNSLKIACKASLKTNQLLDIGDVDGAQKMAKVYDGIMKSGKWTAAQNKAEKGEFVDSVSELILQCEKHGFIPKFYIEQPNDKVDLTLQDMQRYTKTLITEETNLGPMIEAAIKSNAKEDAAQAASTEEEIVDDDDLAIREVEKTIKDSEFVELNEFVENESVADEEFIKKGGDL